MIETLVSVDELKVLIDVQENNTEFDVKLLTLAGTATTLIQNYCRRKFAKKVYTDIFSTRNSGGYDYDLYGPGDGALIPRQGVQRFNLEGIPVDLEQAVAVNIDANRLFEYGTALNNTQFFIDADKAAAFVYAATPQGSKNVKITYTAGYETTEETYGQNPNQITYRLISGAPDDLKTACVTQTMYLFNKIQEGSIGVSGSSGRNSPVYNENSYLLCGECVALVQPYRRILVGKG